MKTIFIDLGGTMILNQDGQAVLNQQLFNTLEKMKDRFQMIILSDTVYDVTEMLENFGITKIFHPVVITKHLFNIDKTDPETYLFACKQVGAEPEKSLLIDNELNFIRTAQQIGITTTTPDRLDEIEKIIKQ